MFGLLVGIVIGFVFAVYLVLLKAENNPQGLLDSLGLLDIESVMRELSKAGFIVELELWHWPNAEFSVLVTDSDRCINVPKTDNPLATLIDARDRLSD